MLILVTAESLKGGTSFPWAGSFGGVVLNTDFMSELRATASTKCKFRFFPEPENRQGGVDDYIVTESFDTMKDWMDTVYDSISIELNVYLDNDSSKATVATLFNNDEIIQAYPSLAPNNVIDRDECWVEINEKGGRVKKYLVAHYYASIATLSEAGSETTSTTSTSTTSTSTSTSTTSTTSTSTTSTSTTSTSTT